MIAAVAFVAAYTIPAMSVEKEKSIPAERVKNLEETVAEEEAISVIRNFGPRTKKYYLPHGSIPFQLTLNSGMNRGLFTQDPMPEGFLIRPVVKGDLEGIEEIQILKGLSSNISLTENRGVWQETITSIYRVPSQQTLDSKGLSS